MTGRRCIQSPLRLLNIPGYGERFNDVVYCYPHQLNSSIVVFFGGDVQDFTENMKSHRDNKNYIKWNLENTAQLLRKSFLQSHIIVIKPSRMELRTFSCYENFVPSNSCGAPDHVPMYNGLKHLQLLLENLSKKLQTMSETEMEECFELSKGALVQEDSPDSQELDSLTCKKENRNLTECSIKLIGFSKGCVVLNQFLHEFHHLDSASEQSSIIPKIKDMYWLDGGHSGGKNTWITSKSVLATLAKLDVRIHVHVTPYQIQDERRPWIKKEEKQFSDTLQRLGVSLQRKVHFENMSPSLLVHFNLLKEFSVQDE